LLRRSLIPMNPDSRQPRPEEFRAYLDESEASANGIYAVGGFVGRTETWELMEPKWMDCLPPGLLFHATDCFSGNRQFEGRGIPERVALLGRLTDLIVAHEIFLVGYGIDARTYQQLAPKPKNNDFLQNKYAAAFGGAVDLVCHAMGNLPGPLDWNILENGDDWESCAFFIEAHKDYSESAKRTIGSMRTCRELWFRNRIGRDSYGTKAEDNAIPLLQTADLGAFLAAKWISKTPDGKIPWTKYYEKLNENKRIRGMVVADEYSVRTLFRTHEELKREAAEGRNYWDGI
jgi:hypothetical protein